jgi:uncharacterized protein (DUF1697 family)
MGRYVALLRGINVGRAKRVPMAELRRLMAALGYLDVRTLLNSGNAVFEARSSNTLGHARSIQAALVKETGVSANVIVLSASEFSAIVSGNPLLLVANDPSRLLVAFVQDRSALQALSNLAKANWKPEALAVGKHAAYLWCPNGILESKVLKSAGRQLGELVTTRNWATVEKLGALLESRAA